MTDRVQPLVVALSWDGQTLIYRGVGDHVRDNRLYHRAMSDFEVSEIPGTQEASVPFLSPDGQWVGFVNGDGALQKVALAGGTAITISEMITTQIVGASWGPDDDIVLGTRTSGLLRVSANGGSAEPFVAPADDQQYLFPHVLPNGQGVLFTVRSASGDLSIAVYSAQTGAVQRLVDGSVPQVSDGHLVFGRESSLWAVPFDLDRL